MKWLITGGCGFIGSNLVEALAGLPNCRVRVLDDLSVGGREDLHAVAPGFSEIENPDMEWGEGGSGCHCQLVVGDVRDPRTAVDAATGADAIVHLAGSTGVPPSVADPRSDCVANVLGTFNMLEAARLQGVGRFVFASSGAPVGDVDPPIHEALAPRPMSPYGASKLAGEGYCSAYFHAFGIQTVALRFGNVYGPGSSRKTSVVARFIREAMAGEPWQIYGDGGQTRDFIYIDDIVSAITLSATVDGIGGEVFQIATGGETTISELASMLSDILSDKGISGVEIRHEVPRIGDIQRNFSDTRKACNRLEWVPRVSLDVGLRRTVRALVD